MKRRHRQFTELLSETKKYLTSYYNEYGQIESDYLTLAEAEALPLYGRDALRNKKQEPLKAALGDLLKWYNDHAN